jgi:hypothetical protein
MSIRAHPVRHRYSGGIQPPRKNPKEEPMRYAILIYDEQTANPSPTPPDPQEYEKVVEVWDNYTKMLKDTGAFVSGEALQPVTTATTVRIKDGKTLTTDGPFAETKEALGGFYLIEARDLDHALELAAACPGAQDGSIEVRPIMEFADAEHAIPVGEGQAVSVGS